METTPVAMHNLGSSVDQDALLEDQDDSTTLGEVINSLGFGKYQIRLTFVMGCAWAVDAMEMMLLSVIGPVLLCEWYLSSWQEAFITTVVFMGFGIGAPIWGWLADIYGRKIGLLSSSFCTFFYGILCALSPSYFWVIFTRTITGFGISGAAQAVTLYSEFLPVKARARSIVFLQSFWSIGASFEVILAFIVMPTLGWRYLVAFSSLPCLVFCFLYKIIPESPRYLLISGQRSEAMSVLHNVATANRKSWYSEDIKLPSKGTRGRIWDLLKPPYTKTTLLMWSIWFSAAALYYGIILMTPVLYTVDRCGNGENSIHGCICKPLSSDDYRNIVITTVSEFPGMIFAFLIVEQLGRKKALCLQFSLAGVFLFMLIICSARVPKTILIFCVRALISGAFQVAYVYTPEVYPTTFRALGLGFCSSFARIGAMITPFLAQVMLPVSDILALSIYACISFAGGISAMLLPIETKGRIMQESKDMEISSSL
ncbi:Synaptic vesicle 2-related protein [Trichoplax sp. H2]|nr:Synaptic vesicle 2-related protein [Trichoplax sp. H2]|eukprot:RDD44803.1 Synaptic vesicle 2-related protein [Trichoplax sp. H2]